MLMARLVTTGQGSFSPVSPVVFVVQWGGGQELNPILLGTGEACGTRALSPYLTGVVLSLCDTGQTNPGIRAVLVILA